MEIIFYGGIALGLLGITAFFLIKNRDLGDFAKIAGLTIVVYRIVTVITRYYYAATPWWQKIYSDNLNHYQIGILILILVLLFWPKLGIKLKVIAGGIGLGMILDEISDLLKLIPFVHLPPYFRDSVMDMWAIGTAYCIFLILLKIFEIIRPKNK